MVVTMSLPIFQLLQVHSHDNIDLLLMGDAAEGDKVKDDTKSAVEFLCVL